jgi:hypothetical protein
LAEVRARLRGMGVGASEARRILRRPSEILRLASAYRAGVLRGYGNAIQADLATEFIRAVMEVAE